MESRIEMRRKDNKLIKCGVNFIQRQGNFCWEKHVLLGSRWLIGHNSLFKE
jgi:hypothetical protein